MQLRPTYIRARLTLWYVGIFGLVLVIYAGGACSLEYWQLNDQLYRAEVQDMETVEGLLYLKPDGNVSLHEEYHNHPQSRLLLDRLLEVLDTSGNVRFRNEKLNNDALGGGSFAREKVIGYYARRKLLADGTNVLVISHLHSVQGQPLLIRLAYSIEPLRVRLDEFLGLLLLAMPFALIAAGLAGYRIAGKALNPLEHMARLTEQITARSLNERVPVENPGDEFGHMARVLNGLLERLQESFDKLERFTSDVSHELRTPLASIRSVGEVGLQQDHSPEKYRDIIGSMLEEVARLTSMIDTLLTIAYADSGAIDLRRTDFSFMDLIQESVAVVGVLAEDKKQTIVISGHNGIAVNADRAFLRMAVVNLLDNAVKYSPQGCTIRLSLLALQQSSPSLSFAELAIEDEGPGIPEEIRGRVFDRFYRVDEARTRDSGGAGLGLAIAKWAVEVHGGEIMLRSVKDRGAVFCIRLPIA